MDCRGGRDSQAGFDAFVLLHELGDERIAEPEDDVLVTRRKDGSLVIAVWNLVEPAATGPDKTFTLDLKSTAGCAHVTIRRVDAAHGDTLAAWEKMGSPRYPTQAQIAALKKASANQESPRSTPSAMANQLTLTVPPKGLAVVEIH